MPFSLTMPKMSPTMTEGAIAKWHKKEGDFVKTGELIIEVATDKATVEYNALDEGYLRKILVKEGEEAIVNQPIAIFTEKQEESIDGYVPEGTSRETTSTPQKKSEKAPSQTSQEHSLHPIRFTAEKPIEAPSLAPLPSGQRLLASPLAKRLAQQQGLDITTVSGSGPRGRVMSRDLKSALTLNLSSQGRQTPSIPSGTYEEVKLTPMRKAIGQRLQQSKSFIPHFYATIDIDAEALSQMREQLKTGEIKVTFNDLIIKATALALRQHPIVNSGYNAENFSRISFKTIDISVAVNLENGLITPIIRHADCKSITEISEEVKVLAGKAREGRLQENEYKGGSFTISNLGMFGITQFQAIINPPQVGNLAVGTILDVPVVKGGKIVPGKQMCLTLSADHRIVDGAEGASFLQTIKKILENPALILV